MLLNASEYHNEYIAFLESKKIHSYFIEMTITGFIISINEETIHLLQTIDSTHQIQGKSSLVYTKNNAEPALSDLLLQNFKLYNSVSSTHALLKHTDCTFCLNNNALYDVCNCNLDIEQPTYSNLNQLIAQVISLLTTSLCFDGSYVKEEILNIYDQMLDEYEIGMSQTRINCAGQLYHYCDPNIPIIERKIEPDEFEPVKDIITVFGICSSAGCRYFASSIGNLVCEDVIGEKEKIIKLL